ncbi:MAG TPA: arginine--tRNA ligase [Pyrinomonadaceae bacterium]|nr:arginine--tRNA ligase [Pyrinomonadaceae bacterium]
MSLLELQQTLREKVLETAKSVFNIELGQIASEFPPKTELGDLAFPVAFELAKRIKQETGEKRNPREIAEQLKIALESNENVDRVEVAGVGYLNVFYKRAKFLLQASQTQTFKTPTAPSPKRIVEHTAVNPNKAAHIGHVRNSVLGDTFVRILQANGDRVEVQNYIDNTGVQVADVVVAFIYLEKMNLEDIKRLDTELAEKNISFDYYCWDLYAKVGQEYAVNEQLKSKRAEVLHLIEEGSNETAELADYVATRNVECILKTMERLSIRYDLLPRESEILHLQFWAKAFKKMKELGVIRLETEGKNAGCWVMPFDTHSGNEEFDSDKILVKSNGIVTYTGKDIAYQLWKLGCLGLDFNYKLFQCYDDGKEVWVTTTEQTIEQNVPKFGGGDTVYNVIDTRQSYPQDIVKKGVSLIAPEKGEAASVHLSYDMVALSPSAAEELGFVLSEDDKKRSFIEMAGRKGLGVKADDLINRLDEKAFEEVSRRNPEFTVENQKKIAHQIAVGALRYFLLKFTRTTLIVFDFKEALSFEGETGAYCQNAAVRFNSIFKKLEENALESAQKTIADVRVTEIFASEIGTDIWSLVTLASRLEETILQAATANEPAILAKYSFNLAKAMHLFHHNHRIISEEDSVKRAVLIVVADIARRSLTSALEVLGIEVPERM